MSVITKNSVRDQAYEVIKNEIIRGTLPAGTRIVEENMGLQYGISRTPLREALHRLESDGFLARLPQRGLVVSEVSLREINELYEVRCYIEGLATRLATLRMTEQDREYLKGLKARGEMLLKNGCIAEARNELLVIHRFIHDKCDQRVCVEFLDKMQGRIDRYKYLSVLAPGRVESIVHEHLQIVVLMIAGEADRAEMAMRKHLQGANESCKYFFDVPLNSAEK